MRLAPGAASVAAVPAAVGAIGAVIGAWPLAAIGALLAVAVLAFYRDPARQPAGDGVLAPADGVVHEVVAQGNTLELATFLNVHNVHVIRAPAAGTVESIERVDGHRRPAFLSGAVENAGVRIETEAWTATLRAGFLARRVTPYVAVGDTLERGERIGHIAFGSRVDLAIGDAVDPADVAVAEGDRVYAGRTVVVGESSQ